VFTSASLAVSAAVALQLALRSVPLKVRMGLHTGDATLRDGDYYGLTPTKCARVRAVAAGGQILCSHATTAVVADLPLRISLRDLGAVRLKSFTEPERVSQVCHPELRDDFARIDVHESLPAALTTFVGRDREQKELLDALDRARLVTLTGSGGCGKSRLAVETARTLDAFPGGVWFVDFTPVVDPQDIPKHVAAALGIPPSTDVAAGLREFLGRDASMVILDNCEHQVDDIATLAEWLLQTCRGLRLVATSREPLGISGEAVIRVPSLSIDESTRLFADRATAVAPGFAIAEHNQAAVTDICVRLDGIPLAIELAAARTSALGVHDVLRGLEDRFALLTSGGRTALSRQRTLEASVDWSYDLLADDERRLLRAISVFVETFSLDALRAMTADDRVVDTVSSLVAKSLVQPVDVMSLPRYRLLDTIRHYAQRKLVDAGEQADVLETHYRCYARLADTLHDALWTGDQSWAARTAEAELANIRAAAEYACGNGDAEGALALVRPLWITALDARREERAWVQRLLDAAVDAPVDLRYPAYWYLTCIAMNGGDIAGTLEIFVASAATRAALTEPPEMALAAAWEGTVHSFTSVTRGRASYDRGERLAADQANVLPGVIYLRGMTELRCGDRARALSLLDDAAARAAATGQTMTRAIAVGVGADANLQLGDLDRAEALTNEALELAEHFPPRYLLLNRLTKMELALLTGDVETARALLAQSQQLARAYPLTRNAEAHVRCKLAMWDGDHAEALAAIADFAAAGGIRPFAALDQVEAALSAGRPDLAETITVSAERMLASIDPDTLAFERAGTLLARARLALHAAAFDVAVDAAREALSALEVCHVYLAGPDALRIAGLAFAGAGDLKRGVRLAAAGEAMRAAMGAVAPPYRVRVDHLVEHGEDWDAGSALSWREAVAYAQRGRGSRRRPTSGWASLTPTEDQVVGLVAAGLSNKEVAARLFMSVPTAKSHLTHVFAKLGLSSRGELIAAAASRPLTSSDSAGHPPTSG
jgi:predicted ATPase/DNA-binding CsgD family transcriptional regulator/tetratricopeptide (TPR) repeat protein